MRNRHFRRLRFIPACAGNTVACPQYLSVDRFIPACAGNTYCDDERHCTAGSSPRARGTLRAVRRFAHTCLRFIPACAGNTVLQVAFVFAGSTRRGSSPRAREHGSPRARGTPRFPVFPCVIRRFIPACAGNTTKVKRQPSGRNPTVHPRVRGEHYRNFGTAACRCTVHPRVRGEHDQLGTRQGSGGRAPVHPRVRGEHISPVRRPRSAFGSSPRARGTRLLLSDPASLVRNGSSPRARGTQNESASIGSRSIIGSSPRENTKIRGREPTTRSVHPRVRGEHRFLGHGWILHRAGRFIPACAGNTRKP